MFNKNKYILLKIDKSHKKKCNFILVILLCLIILPNNKPISEFDNNQKSVKTKLLPTEIIYKGKKYLKSNLINDFLSKISDDLLSEKREEMKKFNLYYNLADYSNDTMVKYKLKNLLLKEISSMKKQNISQIDIFYLSHNINFGNNLIAVNNAIFYCEIIGCHKIILNKDNLSRKWLIIEPIYDKELNITIILGSNVNCTNSNILCLYEVSWSIYFPIVIKPQVRISIIKSEILKNLPKVNINKDDLFIHIRSGDIFKYSIGQSLGQPPLCFYDKILIKYKMFRNIYIVSMDNGNVIVNALINKYRNIIYNVNNLEYDISLLSHAYNLVMSVSTFCHSSVKLNDNLKNIWEFDIIRLTEKFFFLHHHIFKSRINYKIYTMKPSDIYINKMFKWTKSPEQIKLMLEAECPYDFTETKPNI